MASNFQSQGPVTTAESIRDVTIYWNYNVHTVRELVHVPSTMPRTISLRPIPEAHGTFIGRVKYVDFAIKKLMSHPVSTDCQIQFPCFVIHALGGYGKTQTARRIASVCRKKRKFHQFIWIDSDDDVSIRKCFVDVRKQIGLASSNETFESPNFNSLMHQFYNFLVGRKHEKFLIIFDNVEDFDKILDYLPLNYRPSNIAVLVTSQSPFTRNCYGNVTNQPLDLMLEKEAMQLVENILGRSSTDSERDKKLLVERSGRIALVLCVMTSTIKFQRTFKSDYRIEDYLEEMCDKAIQYIDESKVLDLTYEKSLQTIVRFAVAKLNAVGWIGKIAVKFFDRAVYCSSTNMLTEDFVRRYLQDICEEPSNVYMALPMRPESDLSFIRMAIEKLSEFSLVEHRNDKFTVHRWIQASRRLDLKDSGDERRILKGLLSIVPDMSDDLKNTSIIWQHVADYADLVNEFFADKGTLLKFPIRNADALEKIIGSLTETKALEQFDNFSEEIVRITDDLIEFASMDALARLIHAFNYDMSKNSSEYISRAILHQRVDVIKWLINEKSCRAEECHLSYCFRIVQNMLVERRYYLTELNIGHIIDPEKKRMECPLHFAIYKLMSCYSPWSSRYIKSYVIGSMWSALKDLVPLRNEFREIIEKNTRKNPLERLFHSQLEKLESESTYWTSRTDWTVTFEVIKFLLCDLKKLEPSIELNEILEKYSGKNLLECLFICGRFHCSLVSDALHISRLSWNDLHWAAFRNDLIAIDSIDPTLTESKTHEGMTPIMCAACNGSCEATTVLLEKYSANVNAVANGGWTPLMYAIGNYYPSIVNILLCHRAKTYWKTESGESVYALHAAVKSCENCYSSEPEQMVEAVLASDDCDVSATDGNRENILHLLVRHYYATNSKPNHRVLRLILATNATLVNIENNDRLTPLQLAKNFIAKFTDDHWHVKSLKSFISELDKVCNSQNIKCFLHR